MDTLYLWLSRRVRKSSKSRSCCRKCIFFFQVYRDPGHSQPKGSHHHQHHPRAMLEEAAKPGGAGAPAKTSPLTLTERKTRDWGGNKGGFKAFPRAFLAWGLFFSRGENVVALHGDDGALWPCSSRNDVPDRRSSQQPPGRR